MTPPEVPAARRVGATAVVCTGLFMLGMDLTVLNVAVPDLQQDLAATTAQIQWIVDGYAVVLGAAVLPVGAFTDAVGRKRSFIAGVALCGAASAAGAVVQQPAQVIAARGAMGAGAALLMPATLAIIHGLFPEPGARSRAISAWAAIGGLGGLSGPVIGGRLVEQFSWRAAFWANLPLAAAVILAALALVPESRAARRSSFDVPGAALSGLGLLALVYTIIDSPRRGWTSPLSLAGFAAAALLLCAFVLWQHRASAPMLPLSVVGRPGVGIAACCLALMSFALFGGLFVLTLYLQSVLGYSPWQAGLRTLPLPAGLMTGAACAVPLTARRGVRLPVVGGLCTVTTAFAFLAGTHDESGYPRCLAFQMVAGLGAGLVAAAATESVMGSVPGRHAGLGSALNDATRQVGSALGVAVQGSVLASTLTGRLGDALTRLDLPVSLSGAAVGATGVPAAATGLPAPLRAQVVTAAHDAFVTSMDRTALVAAAATLLAAAIAARCLPARAPATASGTHEAHHPPPPPIRTNPRLPPP